LRVAQYMKQWAQGKFGIFTAVTMTSDAMYSGRRFEGRLLPPSLGKDTGTTFKQ